MKVKQHYFTAILLLLLTIAALCSQGGASASSAQGYMIRAVLLQETDAQITVAVLYQDPEAAANSADVRAPMQFAQGQGSSLSTAFQSLEQGFSAAVSYQLCDYLLLCSQCSKQTVAEYALFVQSTQQGRYAAQLAYLVQPIEHLALALQSNTGVAQQLLEQMQEKSDYSPYLYEVEETVLAMPCYVLQQDGSVEAQEITYLLAQDGVSWYNETQTQLYHLLCGGSDCDFVAGELAFTVSGCVLSWESPLQGVVDGHAVTQGDLPTLVVHGMVQGSATHSHIALSNMEAYLAYQAKASPCLLGQIGAGAVEVHLFSLANLW